MIEPKQRWRRYHTPNGICINEDCEKVIQGYLLPNYTGKIQLILTSPPFPLKRAKKYGNKVGTEYLEWLCNIGKLKYFSFPVQKERWNVITRFLFCPTDMMIVRWPCRKF